MASFHVPNGRWTATCDESFGSDYLVATLIAREQSNGLPTDVVGGSNLSTHDVDPMLTTLRNFRSVAIDMFSVRYCAAPAPHSTR